MRVKTMVAKQPNIQRLVSRLRDLESEVLRLSITDLPPERQPAKEAYEQRLNQLEQSHSGSWFGDHSATYFDGFMTPPPGRSFDVEWGFEPGFNGSHNPGWQTYSQKEICDYAFEDTGQGILDELQTLAGQLADSFATVRDQAIDVLDVLVANQDLRSLVRYKEKLEQDLKPYKPVDYINGRKKNAPRMTRDSQEVAKGSACPTHVLHLAAIKSLDINRSRAKETAGVLRNIIEAVGLHEETNMSRNALSKIFIGHGRSELWRVLKDFVSDRLELDYEEFNRVPTAGMSTQERLSEMLEGCGFAFLIFTGEDLRDDNELHARENVVHEAGLFQGRLGWRKAIILLEDGCEEFSNITGLVQIRFPKGKIEGCFEEVRLTLERESVLQK
jgi:predicted nucleotide-binding protein